MSINDPSMLESFPSLIPSKNFKSWKGYVQINMHSIYIEITCPYIPKLHGLEVCFPEFEVYNCEKFDLKERIEVIKKETHSLAEFLKTLISDLGKVNKKDYFANFLKLKSVYTDEKFYTVIQEINLYDQYVYKIDENLKHVVFNVIDICKQDHLITIFIPDDYAVIKKQPLSFETIIPLVTMNSLLKSNTISNLIEAFKQIVNDVSNFWIIREDIINTCNALGSYSFKDVTYKIPIDHHVCVEVEIDPYNPLNCPKFDFRGRSESIEKFKSRLNSINPILIWNTESNFKENMLNVFEIEKFESQFEENNFHHDIKYADNSDYCFICYDTLDATMKKQIKTCVNEMCDALYHMGCICEWLLNSGSTPMFEHLQGKCPQCEEDLLVALENFDLIKN